jgi:hypothetical protein
MATTWIKAIHRSGANGISAAIKRTVEYTMNYDKTFGGELIASFECDPLTAQSEFMLSKRLYEQRTGRNQGKHDVIGYQIRQSFKPGEITAQEALKIGYELAMRWTRGRHQFIVAAHTNTANPHTHVFYNSVTLDHSGKFADFKRSAIALRRVSDKLCIEHGLSIVEKPGLSKGHNRVEYLGERKLPTGRDKLREQIDNSFSAGMSFTDFLAALSMAGCEIKSGKQTSIKLPGSKKFFRLDTLGADYTDNAIRERLAGIRVVAKSNASSDGEKRKAIDHAVPQNRPNLLIDIQARIKEGAGDAYVQWMKVFNLQTAARTLIFLKEQGVDSYDELKAKSSAASSEFNTLTKRIREIETQQKGTNELQKQIGNYGKTRDIYAKYKRSGWDKGFYEVHRAEIILHRSAKKYCNELGMKKLPSINSLKQEWVKLDAERRKLYSSYKAVKQKFTTLGTAKANADVILFGARTSAQKMQNRDSR